MKDWIIEKLGGVSWVCFENACDQLSIRTRKICLLEIENKDLKEQLSKEKNARAFAQSINEELSELRNKHGQEVRRLKNEIDELKAKGEA